MAVHAPTEVLPAPRREGYSERCVWKPLELRDDETGCGTPTLNHVHQVCAVVEEKVGVDPLTVLVYELCEAQASPT